MKFTDSKLDDLTHTVAAVMRNMGLNIQEHHTDALNDTLQEYLITHTDAEIVPSESTEISERVSIEFDVEPLTKVVSVSHEIEILNLDYNKDKIVDGLKTGNLSTTMYHDSYELSYITDTFTGENIAVIHGQEVDGMYSNYR